MADVLGVVGLVAAKRGLGSLVTLLTNKESIGDGISDVVGELLASTVRIEERLRVLEVVLGDLVSKPYLAALDAGNRHLADALLSTNPSIRIAAVQNA